VHRLSRALQEKRLEYEQRRDKIILLYDNVRPHVTKVEKNLEKMGCFTRRILQTLLLIIPKNAASYRFTSFAEIENWFQNWIASKDESFFRDGIRK